MANYFFKRLFDGEQWRKNVRLTVSRGRVANLVEGVELEPGDVSVSKAIKGFVDIQVNGGGGTLLNHDPSVTGIRTMVAAHAAFGTTEMLPTLITDDIEVIEAAAHAIAEAVANDEPGVLGVHFEGPHLSQPKKGTHAGEKIRGIADREWTVYERDDLGIKLVTVAPETVTPAEIERLVAAGVIVFIGHTNATYEETVQALNAGAVGFTHLYNAMSPFTSREAGAVGAALLDSHSWCGVINDGHHVSKQALEMALRLKPKGKVLLVTDAMSLVGTEETEFAFFGRTVYRDGDRLTSSTGELAGSHLTMLDAVRRTQRVLGLSFEESVRMASVYPMQCLSQTASVKLCAGSLASWIELDDDTIVRTVSRGETLYNNNN